MKSIYIKNYNLVPKEDKVEFIRFINVFRSFKVVRKKTIISDNALILEFGYRSDIELARKTIVKFFKKNDNVETMII